MKKLIVILFSISLIISSCGKKQENAKTEQKSEAKIETVEYKCEGMHCSGCESAITEEVTKLDGIKEIKADAKAKMVTVSFDASKTNIEKISGAINAAGYDTQLSKTDNKHDCEKDSKKE